MGTEVMFDPDADAYSKPLDEIDVSNPALYQKDIWYSYFDRLRREDPVHYTERSPYGPYWSITKFKDIVDVEINHKVFSSDDKNGGIFIGDSPKGMERTNFIRLDPPEHDLQRRVASPAVSPAVLMKLKDLIRERTGRVLDGLPRGEEFDWVDRVSIELTSMMLATLFDYPVENARKLVRWSEIVLANVDAPDAIVRSEEERFAEQVKYGEHMNELWEARARSETGSDIISILARHPVTRDMSLRDRMGILILFLVGGNDTTRNSMSGGLWAFNQFPDEFEKFRKNPHLVETAVPEIVRWQTPVIHVRRTATDDAMIGDKKIKRGDKVVLWYISGNRDEESIENPNEFMVDRQRAREHLSFGFGIHRCLGNRLAELQLRTLWEEVLARDLRIEALDKPVYAYSNFVRTIRQLRVRIAK